MGDAPGTRRPSAPRRAGARLPASPEAGGDLLKPVLVAWGLAAIVLTLAMAGDIAGLRFPDPDDAMRLLEVRDWLAGQSWWDVGQHRFNRGDYPMHWSRLVDLPLAGVLALATPLLGDAAATRIAMVAVPLVALLAAMALIARITRTVRDTETARYAVLLAPLSVPLVYQLRPMRIDHHGWQVVLALAAAALLLGRPTARAGAAAGLALAALLTVSLEGLPIAATIAGVAALAWAWQPERRGFLLGLLWSLAGGAALLHLATRGPGFLVPACDAMAPGWLVMLATAAASVSAATLAGSRPVAIRLAALGGCGAATAASLALAAPACLAGPFAALPPLAYKLWYLNVAEGRPIWDQSGFWAAMTVGLPIVGLAGTVRAWREAQGAARTRWAMLLALAAASFALALLVNRAAATANALAIPGAAALLLTLLHRARAVRNVPRRLLATAGALLVASPGQAAALALLIATASAAPEAAQRRNHAPCVRVGDVRPVGREPAGIVFAPIDIAPDIIATTHHRGIAGGYHRAPAPMEQVLAAFSGSPEQARRIILASGADYLAACPGINETDLYRHDYPGGLWARLERGERFDWLEPIATGTPAMAWRVIRPLPSPTRPR